MRIATLATCTINQWALDFSGNYLRILESIKQAKLKGATYRCGPELEITGYGCGDHFHESDTLLHSWEVLIELLKDPECSNIIVDVGMPVMHKNVIYNCRVLFLNQKILFIRPKTKLCDSGMYRESRWFTAWVKEKIVEDYYLPQIVQCVADQRTVPFGDAILTTFDTTIGFEICEELWNPQSSHVGYVEEGVEILVNASGGFHEIGNLSAVAKVIKSATEKCGGLYLFSNLRGCDGDRVYYHGTSHITLNGKILSMGKQFSLQDVEVVTATVDLDDIIRLRKRIKNVKSYKSYPRVHISFNICNDNIFADTPSEALDTPSYESGEELTLGPACWLWDNLKRGSSNGFLLPLDQSVESLSSAVIVFSLCNLIFKSINEGNIAVLTDLRSILQDSNYKPINPKELCNRLLVTCCLPTDKPEAESKLTNFINEIGSCHFSFKLDFIVNAILATICIMINASLKQPNDNFKECPAYSSLKKRLNNVLVYLIAEMFLWSKGKSGNLLVLGTGFAEKSLVGDFVKYGDFCGDVSVTAAISRRNLELLLEYSINNFKFFSLQDIIGKQVVIIDDTASTKKNDFEEDEIKVLSSLRRNYCGPYSAFCKLSSSNSEEIDLLKTADKVKKFFHRYSFHRSKILSTVVSYHADPLAASNCYLDQRPILYNVKWTWQFNAIDREINCKNKMINSIINN